MLLAVVIEEERRSKEALRESKDQMGLAAEAANAAMWVWDVSGDDLWMTEQGRSLFGFKPDARLDFAAIFDRVHPEDRAARERAIKRALETRGEYEMEYRVLEPDGAVRWINGRGRCVEPDDGSGLKLFGVSMDVTARKQAEASAARARGAPAEAGAAGARRTRRHARRAHRNPDARTEAAAHRDPASTPPSECGCSTHPNPTFRRCATRSPTSARSPSAPAK